MQSVERTVLWHSVGGVVVVVVEAMKMKMKVLTHPKDQTVLVLEKKSDHSNCWILLLHDQTNSEVDCYLLTAVAAAVG